MLLRCCSLFLLCLSTIATGLLEYPLPRKSNMKQLSSNINNYQLASIDLPRDHTWVGWSRAGEATSFAIPQLRLVFDCGLQLSTWKPKYIFITHVHMDHIQALIQVLFDRNNTANKNSVPIIVYCPAPAVPALRTYLQAFYELIQDDDSDSDSDDNSDDDNDCDDNDKNENEDNNQQQCNGVDKLPDMEKTYGFQLHPLEVVVNNSDDNQQQLLYPLVGLRSGSGVRYYFKTVVCHHRKVCLGYSIYQRRQVVKEEYRHLSGIELGNMIRESKKSGGESIKEEGPLEPLMVFLGDTTHKVFLDHPEILKEHNIVAIECSFWQEKDLTRAHKTKHMHWQNLEPYVQQYPQTLFLLQHFSKKHSVLEWWQWLQQYNKTSGNYNIHPMLSIDEIQYEHEKLQEKEKNKKSGKKKKKSDEGEALLLSFDSSSLSTCNCFVCQPNNKQR